MQSVADAIKAVKNPKATKQDTSEIADMVAFYSRDYSEVYLIHCLNCKRVIGVEVAPAKGNEGLITDRGRALFMYQDLCLSVRVRDDKTPLGEPMVGYECKCGNRTTISPVEQGIVAERTVHVSNLSGQIADGGEPLPVGSPFENAKVKMAVDKRVAETGYTADYEVAGTKERYESFMLERVK